MVPPMQIKTIGFSFAALSALALILSCSNSQAETANTNTSAEPTVSTMTSELQDGGIPAPADVAAAPSDALTTASGLAYKVLTPGTGTEHPAAVDEVTVHYTGWTTDGKMFDSSVQRGASSSFPLMNVIAGWTEGLQLMVVGEKTLFWIPEALAYQGSPGKPAGMLVFEVELLSIKKKPAPPKVPEDLTTPPADATTTASGLIIRTLVKGTGTEHPGAADEVTVHYSGWTTDGKMFDSSVTRGEPTSFPLGNVIAGWTEGVQLMVVGEKARLWIPEALAYAGQAGAPAGILVFDIELISMKSAPKTPDNLATPPEDATTTDSGLVVHTMVTGDATQPTADATTVLVHFSFWDQTGKMYQSTRMSEGPAVMELATGSIPGLTEGLNLLHVGDKARLWIPEELGFPSQPGAPKGLIVFDVEIMRTFTPPANVAGAPADAIKTESGLAYTVIKAGGDAESTSPTMASTVAIHYTGWSTEGKLLDSSHIRAVAAEFPLAMVMAGWQEGIQLMKAGDHYRFWIPKSLGIPGNPGQPAADVLFDIELISFE